uniref:TBC1 domain family member 10A n=1 Tax=Corvus moneduloides TaxID=1196302 RepID=A0A8U7MYV0_CORMO
MAKSRGGGGPSSPGGRSLAGTRESLADPGGDELSSLGSDSEINGGGPEERRVDKFGFIVGSRGAEGTLEEVPLEVLRQRESKWLDMLNNWDKWMAKKHKKELDLLTGDPKWLDVIERDLHRQFPFHEMFVSRGGHGQQDLFRVLKAYTLYRPEEGYCQAQAPIAAVLLMHMPAEQAFWCLVQICEKYLPGYYSEKLEAIQLDGQILFSLLHKVSPVAYKHLSKQKIDPILYMTEWFMCAFSRTLPWSSVLRVWDMFFCEGVKIIFRVGLVLLKHTLGSSDKLKSCQGQYETMERLRALSPKIMQEAFLVQEVRCWGQSGGPVPPSWPVLLDWAIPGWVEHGEQPPKSLVWGCLCPEGDPTPSPGGTVIVRGGADGTSVPTGHRAAGDRASDRAGAPDPAEEVAGDTWGAAVQVPPAPARRQGHQRGGARAAQGAGARPLHHRLPRARPRAQGPQEQGEEPGKGPSQSCQRPRGRGQRGARHDPGAAAPPGLPPPPVQGEPELPGERGHVLVGPGPHPGQPGSAGLRTDPGARTPRGTPGIRRWGL